MNGLVGIQWGEICVNLPIILGNMQAVGTDIVTVRKNKKVSEHQDEGGMQRPEAMVYSKLGKTTVLPKLLFYQKLLFFTPKPGDTVRSPKPYFIW